MALKEPALAGQYAILPVGAAVLLLLATPVLGGLPGWHVLAAAILSGVLLVPMMLNNLIGHEEPAGDPDRTGRNTEP